jgi:hypothetical protein
MRSSLRPAGFFVAALTFAIAGCSSASSDDGAAADHGAIVQASTSPKLCAAVRGNGESILTHFASLSQIVEHYGVVDGMAGGSSGSITTFTYESILKNPVMHQCAGAKCTPDADAARVSLALKSLQGYADTVGDSDEANSIKGLVATAGQLKADYDAKGIDALGSEESVEAAKRLNEVLSVPEVRSIVNPEIFTMLADVDHLSFNVNEIKTSISQLGAFKVDDNRLFFRSGVLAWPALATLFGRIGDFYAGYGPADKTAMSAWLDACAEGSRGKSWSDASQIANPAGGTCGSTLETMITTYRAKVRGVAEGTYPSRLDEMVGDPASPLHKLVSTAVLERDAVTKYNAARARYVTGEFPTGSIPFAPDFSDVNFGYWGSDSDIEKVQANSSHFDDLKSKKFSSLGNSPWREILAASPAEPGLSRFVELKDGRYSAGGWADLAPALVLKNIGCETVVYVTREGDESDFATKIAKNAGMSEGDWGNLYDLSNEGSSYSRSVATADAVWCTNWNGFTDSQMSAEVLDAFNAPLETRASFASAKVLSPYSGVTTSTGKPGCTPGVSAGAKFPQ